MLSAGCTEHVGSLSWPGSGMPFFCQLNEIRGFEQWYEIFVLKIFSFNCLLKTKK
jgi:hypothetical protein